MDKTKKSEEKIVDKASHSAEVKRDKPVAKEEKKECAQCDEMAKQGEEYKTKYLRAIADYQNYERRVQDQRTEWTKNGNKNVILKLLTFLDDLERAEIFIKDPNLVHIKESFLKMLKNEGLEEIEVLGKPYDPHNAEVVDMKEGKEDNIVLVVLRKGYTYNGQQLRVAQVTVSSKKAENKL